MSAFLSSPSATRAPHASHNSARCGRAGSASDGVERRRGRGALKARGGRRETTAKVLKERHGTRLELPRQLAPLPEIHLLPSQQPPRAARAAQLQDRQQLVREPPLRAVPRDGRVPDVAEREIDDGVSRDEPSERLSSRAVGGEDDRGAAVARVLRVRVRAEVDERVRGVRGVRERGVMQRARAVRIARVQIRAQRREDADRRRVVSLRGERAGGEAARVERDLPFGVDPRPGLAVHVRAGHLREDRERVRVAGFEPPSFPELRLGVVRGGPTCRDRDGLRRRLGGRRTVRRSRRARAATAPTTRASGCVPARASSGNRPRRGDAPPRSRGHL
eukprot:30943-Pelagococcus_subviridis.AAC.26